MGQSRRGAGHAAGAGEAARSTATLLIWPAGWGTPRALACRALARSAGQRAGLQYIVLPVPLLPDQPSPAAPLLQGCAPEPRTYNTIISACAKAGQPDAARGVYERMLADGVQVGAQGVGLGAARRCGQPVQLSGRARAGSGAGPVHAGQRGGAWPSPSPGPVACPAWGRPTAAAQLACVPSALDPTQTPIPTPPLVCAAHRHDLHLAHLRLWQGRAGGGGGAHLPGGCSVPWLGEGLGWGSHEAGAGGAPSGARAQLPRAPCGPFSAAPCAPRA